jgi:hypothetical protein
VLAAKLQPALFLYHKQIGGKMDAERQELIEKFLASCDKLSQACKRMQKSIAKMNRTESEKE